MPNHLLSTASLPRRSRHINARTPDGGTERVYLTLAYINPDGSHKLPSDHDLVLAEIGSPPRPSAGGRPSIGPKVEARLDEETLRRVDEFAAGRSRADALRDLIAAGLDALEPA
ncbi:hypothetical protein [Streptomyces sp. DSM 41534]